MAGNKLDWILCMLRQGCIIYRESEPKIYYQRSSGRILRFHPQSTYLLGTDRFCFDDLVAEDWAYRCPGHDWQYDPDDASMRQYRICEHEEYNGAWANARAIWLNAREEEWRKTAKALPAAGVTTHPEPATCCENYPRCNCEEMNRLYYKMHITEELEQERSKNIAFHLSSAAHHIEAAKCATSSFTQGRIK